MAESNLIGYGITNVYYAVLTETLGENGQYTETYGTPKRLVGARALSLPAQDESVNFPADNNPNYFTQRIFSGYDGTLTLAELSDDFRKDIYGEQADSNGLIGESINDQPKKFALLFQIEGDAHATRHVLYRCSAGKFELSTTTRDTSIEPNEIAIPITAGGRLSDGLVKWRCPATDTQYATWNTAVYVPTFN